jgi:cobalt-zinc-cadmium efflux system protein
VLVAPAGDCHAARERLAAVVAERFGIDHTTLQVDHAQRPELLRIELPPGGVRGATQSD